MFQVLLFELSCRSKVLQNCIGTYVIRVLDNLVSFINLGSLQLLLFDECMYCDAIQLYYRVHTSHFGGGSCTKCFCGPYTKLLKKFKPLKAIWVTYTRFLGNKSTRSLKYQNYYKISIHIKISKMVGINVCFISNSIQHNYNLLLTLSWLPKTIKSHI